MRRRCAYQGQSCHVACAAFRGKCLEGNESLVVIHRHYAVERLVHPVAEKRVCLIRTERIHTLVIQFSGHWSNHLAFLVSVGAGVESQYGYARVVYPEVAFQACEEVARQFLQSLCRYSVSHILYGQPRCCGGQAHGVVCKDAERSVLMPEVCGEPFSQLCVAPVLLSLRTSHEHVEQSFAEVLQSPFRSLFGSPARVFRPGAHVHLHLLVEASQHVYPSLASLLRIVYDAEVSLYVESLPVICGYLWRAVDYRNAQVEHLRFGECLENKFIPYAVSVTVRYGNAYFSVFHICVVVCKK